MGKTALIKITLVNESIEAPNEQIEKEIFECLGDCGIRLPWQKDVVTVKVLK